MQSQAGVVATLAPLNRYVVADLPANAVAVVVARHHVPDRDVGAILKEDAPRVVAIKFIVVSLVPVQGQVLDGHLGNELAAQEGKQGGPGRLASDPKVLPQLLVELKSVPGSGDQGPLDDRRPAVVRIGCAQTNSVAYPESLRVGECDLLVVPVRIGGQLGR